MFKPFFLLKILVTFHQLLTFCKYPIAFHMRSFSQLTSRKYPLPFEKEIPHISYLPFMSPIFSFCIKTIIPSCLPFVSPLSLLLKDFYSQTCLPFVSSLFLLYVKCSLAKESLLPFVWETPSSFLLNFFWEVFSLPFAREIIHIFMCLLNILLRSFSLSFVWEIYFMLVPF